MLASRVRRLLASAGISILCAIPAVAAPFNNVPVVDLPVRGTDGEVFWDAHPYNPKNRDGYHATTNPLPPVVINSPGINGVPGTVVDLASGGSIISTITAAKSVVNGKDGNVTVRLAPGGTYAGFSMNGLHNVHIICPSATNSPDTRPIINGEINLTMGLLTGMAGLDIATYYSTVDSALDTDKAGTGEAWQLFRNPASNIYFHNIRIEHNSLHSRLWRVRNVLFDNCTFKSRYPTTAEKHHRGSLIGAMGNRNVAFLNCEFKGNSENAFYLDGSQCNIVHNCTFPLDVSSDPANNDSDNPVGYNAGPLLLCNDDFTESRTYAPFDKINYEEELNAKYNVIASCAFTGTGQALAQFTGEALLFIGNTHTGSVNDAITWTSRSGSGKLLDDPDFHYNYSGLKVLGNTISGILVSAVSINHAGANTDLGSFLVGDSPAYMGGYRIAGNTISLGAKPLVVESIPPAALPYWHDAGIVGGNVLSGNGTLNLSFGMDHPAPAQPTGLAASAVSTSAIDLAWADACDEETAYYVERSATGQDGSWSLVSALAMNSTGFRDTGLASGTTYYYRVGAVSDYGITYSPVASAASFAVGTPATPSGTTATPLSVNSAQVTWTDNSDNETGFVIERALAAGGPWTQAGTVAAGVATFRDSGLLRSTEYFYRVVAANGGILSSASPTSAATTLSSNPNLVSNSSFESATAVSPYPPSDWQERSYLTRDATVARTGNASWAASVTGTGVYTFSTKCGPLEPNTEYTLSGYVRASGVTSGAGFRLEASVGGIAKSTPWLVNNSAQWQEIKIVFTTSSNSTLAYLRVYPEVNAGKAWLDDVSLRKTDASAPAPAAPAGLSATALDDARVVLAWTDNSTSETEFRIERSPTGSGAWTEVGRIGEGGTAFTDTGLTSETSYHYRVCAANEGGASGYSNTASATTLAPAIPAPPTSLTATTTSLDQVNLAWTDNSQNESYFQIERSATSAAGPFAHVATVASGVVTFTDRGLTATTNYWYRIRATNPTGPSAYTNVAAVTTLTTYPNLIQNPSFELAPISSYWLARTYMTTDTSVKYSGTTSWKASAIGLNSNYNNLNTWGPLENNTTYHLEAYVLSSSNLTGNGLRLDISGGPVVNTGWAVKDSTVWQKISADFTTTTVGAPIFRLYVDITAGNAWIDALQLVKTGSPAQTAPAAPTAVTAAAASGSAVSLSWNDASTNETGFKIERSPDGATGWIQVAIAPAEATSFTDTGLTVGTTYFYRIYSYNSAGNSTFSSVAQAVTAGAVPAAASSLSAVPTSGSGSTSITLTWADNSSNETGFRVEKALSASGPWTQATSVSQGVTTATVGSLASLTTHYFRVVAFNAGGDAAPSATAAAKTYFPSGTTADANANGCSDFLEYALAITDASTLVANLPVADVDAQNYLTLSFVRPEPAPPDAEYQLWASDDLAAWTQIANPAAAATVNGTTAAVVFKDSATLGGKPKRFLKLVVVQIP